jgi:hypothetical protein
MALTFRPTKGFGPDHFSAFEGERKIGHIYKTAEGDWFWGVDYLEAGSKLLTNYAHTREDAMAELQRAWTDVMWAKLLAELKPRNPEAIARASEPEQGN